MATGRPRRTLLQLECQHNSDKFRFCSVAFYQGLKSKVATQLGQVLFSRSLISRTEEQSRTRSGQGCCVEDQPQYRRLCRRRTPCARSFLCSPSPRHPPLTHYPLPPCPLVRGGQTSPSSRSLRKLTLSKRLGIHKRACLCIYRSHDQLYNVYACVVSDPALVCMYVHTHTHTRAHTHTHRKRYII